MTTHYADLMIHVTQKAPWLIEGGERFFPENIQEDVQQILSSIDDCNLTIITEQGRVFNQYLVLRIENDSLLIDKPFEWDNSTTSFHVFFRGSAGIWHFFRGNEARSDKEKLFAEIPDKIFLLQKRRFKRTMLPIGTKVVFRNDFNLIEQAFVYDISEGGLMMWAGESPARYRVDSALYELFILPPNDNRGEGTAFHRVLPCIIRGEVVRTNTDQSLMLSSYGVSFIHESIFATMRLNSLIAELKDHYSERTLSSNGLYYAISRQGEALPKA